MLRRVSAASIAARAHGARAGAVGQDQSGHAQLCLVGRRHQPSHRGRVAQLPCENSERMARDGANVIASSQAEAVKHVQSEMEKWRRVIKERGMRAE